MISCFLLLLATTTPLPAVPQPVADSVRKGYTEADVRFMQGMIHHHAQAVAMSSLVPARTTRQAMHLLAERITVSQRDEIRMMQEWLENRHEEVPEPMFEPDMDMDMPMMPGMLTRAQMKALGAAKGAAFDSLYLTGMIQHHGGAIVMVKDLLAHTGAAQESQIFGFASDVDSDQRAEITRMRKLLDAKPPLD